MPGYGTCTGMCDDIRYIFSVHWAKLQYKTQRLDRIVQRNDGRRKDGRTPFHFGTKHPNQIHDYEEWA